MSIEQLNQILYQLLHSLVQGRSLNEVSEALYHKLKEILPLQRLGIALISDDQTHFISRLNISELDIQLRKGYKAPLLGSSLNQIIETGVPRIINDLKEYLDENPKSTSTRLVVNEGIRSNMSIPLISNNKAIGILFLASTEVNAYNQNHLKIIQQITQMISVMVEKALLMDHLESSQKQLTEALAEKEGLTQELASKVEDKEIKLKEELERHKLLVRITQYLNEGKTLPQIFHWAFQNMKSFLGVQKAALLLAPHFEKKAWVKAYYPHRENISSHYVFFGHSSLEACHTNRDLVYISPNNSDYRNYDQKIWEQLGFTPQISCPLQKMGQVIGFIVIGLEGNYKLSSDELAFLKELCVQLSAAVPSEALPQDSGSTLNRIISAPVSTSGAFKTQTFASVQDPVEIAGISRFSETMKDFAVKAAAAGRPVLISGEPGSGKELLARHIHHHLYGDMVDNFYVFDPRGLARNIAETQLFGSEGKSASHPNDQIGLLGAAQNGTLLIKYPELLPAEIQARLLRLLETGEYYPQGSVSSYQSEAQIIFTSEQVPEKLSDYGLKPELQKLLNVVVYRTTPLRETKEDIAPLLKHFLAHFSKKYQRSGLSFSKNALIWAESYNWPGNTEELRNAVEKGVLVSEGAMVELHSHNSPTQNSIPKALENMGADSIPTNLTWREWEIKLLLSYLQKTNGKIYGDDGAAKLLKLPPTTLQGKLKKLGLSRSTLHSVN